ncbi:MAG: UDP-N-acetylmuramoyl-L-alanine--D-glutamate ligase [Alphaproteobacteria bacterium]|nr:UDP-N-acetylmuramoyl-L-alanine--D-glutamate ligase [Alphaproteobacteria bacterium]
MIEVTTFANAHVAVFGLGRSGLATVRALKAGGAEVCAWDDSPERRDEAEEAGVDLADLYSVDWKKMAALILSPGVPLTHPEPHWVVRMARAEACEVIGDVELFARENLPNAIAAITGTNGKSTTTALTGHVLETCGRTVAMGGNLGTPVLELPRLPENGIYVIEMSSYQIDLSPSLNPDVGVLLNLSPDHIDRHGDMAGYIGVKRDMLERQSANKISIVGVDDEDCAGIFDKLKTAGRKNIVPVSVTVPVNKRTAVSGYEVADGIVARHDGGKKEALVDLSSATNLIGVHNWQNAAAALASATALGCPVHDAAAALLSFPGLAHRMEYVGRIGNIRFINDSKATNAEATARALACFDRIIWIAGGRPKDGGIETLRPEFGRIAYAYLIGEAADEFATTLEGEVPYAVAGTLEQAVTMAAERAVEEAKCLNGDAMPDTAVLLSPAAASFDQFANFELRGNRFRDLVTGLSLLHREGAVAGGQA